MVKLHDSKDIVTTGMFNQTEIANEFKMSKKYFVTMRKYHKMEIVDFYNEVMGPFTLFTWPPATATILN